MHDTLSTLEPERRPLMPLTVVAVLILVMGGASVDVVAGGLSGLTLFGLRWDEGDRELAIPDFTELVLRICFWHNLVWFTARSVLAFGINRGWRWARVTAILVEVGAIAVWVPVFFITVEGPHARTEDSLDILHVAGAVCIGVSIAAIVLLSLNRTREWCTTSERAPARM